MKSIKLVGLKISQFVFSFIFKNIGPIFGSKKISDYNLSLALPNMEKSKRNEDGTARLYVDAAFKQDKRC